MSTTIKHARRHRFLLAAATAAVLCASANPVLAQDHAPSYAPGALLNAGNAQFRTGHPGRAVLDYERGLLLAPRDADLRANLDRARAELALPAPPGGVAEAAARYLSLREWVALGAGSLAALFAALFLSAVAPRRRRLFAGTALAFALVGSVASTALWLATRTEQRAVVVATRAVARVSPFDSADTLFTVAEGHTVEVVDRYAGHLRVEDGPGRVGWVSQDEVIPVVPTPGRTARGG